MERKDLKRTWGVGWFDPAKQYVSADDVDDVMDGYEARIKELEEELATYKQADGSKSQGENVKTKETSNMKRIVLTLKPDFICDTLSINEWNALVDSYENDPKAVINGLAMDEALYIYTTLGNVLDNHPKSDLRFLDVGRTW